MKEKILLCRRENPSWSFVKIAKVLGCDYTTVKHHLNEAYKKKHNEQMRQRRQNRKLQLVAEFGGKCQKCGYAKCIGALDFHHVNGREKDLKDRLLRDMPIDVLRKELKQCILVCANCHREIHFILVYGLVSPLPSKQEKG